MRHRPSASQEWRQQQQQQSYSSQSQQSQPMGRSHTEPIYPPGGASGGGAQSRPGLQPQQPSYQLDSYYDQLQQHQQDQSYGYHQDNSSVYSHTALNLEKDPYYNDAAPSLPPQPQYGAPNYPPSSPLSRPPPTPFSGNLPYHDQQGGHFPYGPPLSPAGPPSFYAQAREQVMKRREQAKVELVDGHLRLDLPVPRSLKQIISFQGQDMREESGKMRYTAVTDDPDDFTRQRYRLRQTIYGRQTELFICLTMYNEDEVLFCRTFTSVLKNIAHLQSRTKSKTWGADSWKKVVVCVVSDGRAKINPRTLKVLGLYGAYQDGIAKDTVDGKDVTGHLFEYTTQVVVDAKGTVSGGVCPVQVLFCLKEQNKKKLNSHRWAFNAFCPQLRPNVCVLLDVGTKPGGTSIYSLWKEFDKHSGIGGACGEITVDLGRGCGNLINPLVAAQNFEYKMSNILDKPLESVFGFISVLPGAFSAYRYKALLGAPLEAYFLGEKMHEPGNVASLADSNMYLAEDRILCFEIVCKKKEAWTLKYVKSAKASTDVPDSVPEFISQRRRWSNGSFFAALHATLHYYRVWTSGQGFFRKLWLSVIWLYNLVQLIFQAIGLSSFYLAFFFLCSAATSDSDDDPFGGVGSEVISVANSVYIATLGVTIVCALGNKPAGSKWWYIAVITCFAVLFAIALYCTIWTIYLAVPHSAAGWRDISSLLDQSAFRNIVISLGATYGLYIIGSILHTDPWHLLTCFIQYMMFLPAYVSVLTIYSFANLHDLAWGTKGSTTIKDLGGAKKSKGDDGKELVEVSIPTAEADIDELWLNMRKDISTPAVVKHEKRSLDAKQADHFANIRTNTLLFYLGLNMLICIFFTSTVWTKFLASYSSANPPVNYYQVGIFWSVAVLSAIRFAGSTAYLVLRLFGF